MNTQKSHFNEGHSHDYNWWRLTVDYYQPSVLENIAKLTGAYYHPEEGFVQGSAYIVAKTGMLTSRTEVINFLMDHAHESSHLIPTLTTTLPTWFFKIVTLEGGIQLWVEASSLDDIQIDVNQQTFWDTPHFEDMVYSYNELRNEDYALLHSTDPKFERDEEVRIVGYSGNYPMTIESRIWLDHPYSKYHLAHWNARGHVEGVMIYEDDCRDKTWVYLLATPLDEKRTGYAIVSEKNVKLLTIEDLDEMAEIAGADLADKDFMLYDSPAALFNTEDDVNWKPILVDGRKGFLTYDLVERGEMFLSFEALGLERPTLFNVTAKVFSRIWLEHPNSWVDLHFLEQAVRENGFYFFKNIETKRNKFWAYVITTSIEGTPVMFVVPEEQLEKRYPEYVNFLRSNEDSNKYMLVERINQLSIKNPKFWDAVVQPLGDVLCDQEYLGNFGVMPMLGTFEEKQEQEYE